MDSEHDVVDAEFIDVDDDMAAMIVSVKIAAISIATALTFFLIYGYGFRVYIALALGVLGYFAAKRVLGFAVGHVSGRRAARALKRLPPHVQQEIIDYAPLDVKDRVAALMKGVRPEARLVNPYYMKVIFRTNLIVLAYLALAWIVGRLSWPLAGVVFIYWLLLPFAIVWSWPEDSPNPRWGRTAFTAIMIAVTAGIAVALLAE
jgi:ABC-type transport system involved in cytochrome bd biosynthesis fused ATPase/permease subunit